MGPTVMQVVLCIWSGLPRFPGVTHAPEYLCKKGGCEKVIFFYFLITEI